MVEDMKCLRCKPDQLCVNHRDSLHIADIQCINSFYTGLIVCPQCGGEGSIKFNNDSPNLNQRTYIVWRCKKFGKNFLIFQQSHFSCCPYCNGKGIRFDFKPARICTACWGKGWWRL